MESPSSFQTPHPSHPRGPSAATRWLAIILLVVAGALVWAVLRNRNQQETSHRQVNSPAQTKPPAEEPPPPTVDKRPTAPPGNLTSDEDQTIKVFQEASASVVHVTSIATRRSRLSMNVLEIPQGTGSGFLWDDKGHVVTNFHVIQNGQSAQVTLNDNSVWPATIVGRAPDKDLAVLRIEAPKDRLRAIPVGTSHDLKVGQKVLAIGNPFGLDQTLTTGVISGLNREIQSITKRPIRDVVQTDAAINPGNSGGPLLDSSGRLIGINTAIYSPSGAYAGIGFAVPADTINRIVPQLVQHGKVVKPGLGIHIGTDELARRLNIEGVLVIDAPPASAAGRAGLKGTTGGQNGRWILGDVITGIDGVKVKTSADLFAELDKHAVGDTVELDVERDKKSRVVSVKLQALP